MQHNVSMHKYTFLILGLLIVLAGCETLSDPAELLPMLTSPTPSPSPTATSTPTATVTPTATSTPTPTPTPTPRPEELLGEAERAYKVGDWARAETLYQRLMPLSSISQEQAQRTALGLGKTLIARDALTQGIALLEDLAANVTQPSLLAEVNVRLGDALLDIGEPAEAAAHYETALDVRPVLAPYAQEWIGDAYVATGVYTSALDAYTEAFALADTAGRQVYLLEKIGLTHAARGVYDETLAAYEAILDIARIPSYRARIIYQVAETARVFGDTQEAFRRYQEIVTAYPRTPQAYEALVQLVEAGVPVDELLRGKIDYYAEVYGSAVAAFYRHIEANPDHTGEAHYYAGLSFLEAGSPELALSEFETLIETHPGDAYWGSAWIGKAEALVDLGRVEEALTAYRQLPASLPDHPRAAEALWEAAELLERQGRLEDAAAAFVDLASRYPDDGGAPDARFQAGLARYRTGAPEDAIAAWEELLRWYPTGDKALGAQFWIGKTYLERGNEISGTTHLSRTVVADPWDYYGLRAADLLAGHAPLAALGIGADLLPCGSAPEQAATVAWLEDWMMTEADPAPDLNLPPEALLSDPRLERGLALLKLGHFDEGRAELEALRSAYEDDAWAQYHLALIFREAGLYRSSILAAATVWRHSPAATVDELPRFLGCLLYPTYFDDLIEEEAEEFGFAPPVLYALLRQESLFEGFATSYAAAHGLMQVIPPTGAEIAEALDWPPAYETPDLYRPMVSVRFGTWYLAQQRDRFAGELYPALAGYNGGPGNAARWWDAAGQDRDLFVELIGFRETRAYVERITEHYAKYRWLYTAR